MRKSLKRHTHSSVVSRWLYLGLSLVLFLSISLSLPELAFAVSIIEYPIPIPNSYPYDITTGPDGNIWFTENGNTSIGGKIGRITATGVFINYTLPNSFGSYNIISGPDGNIWFTESGDNKIGKITLTGVISEYVVPTTWSWPSGVTSGPDGNIWFTESDGNKVGKITPEGVIIEYALPTTFNYPYGITSGPDGNLWFTEISLSYGGKIGKITTAGIITEYPLPTADSYSPHIISGPDGNLWFTESSGNKIGKISPTGEIIEYPVPTINSHLWGITSGADGNIWFTESSDNKIGMLEVDKPPTLTKTFGDSSIPLGDTTSLTFNVTNPNPALTLSGITFTDNLPPGLVVATPSNLNGNCGGTVTAVAGSSTISLSGGTLAGGANCTIVVNVTITTPGTKTNITGKITATETGEAGRTSNTAILNGTIPPPKEVHPADIVAQLRVTPDRYAATDPSTEISYTLSLKNVGPGSASSVSIRFPIDPNLDLGYATFSDPRVWVSAIVTDTANPYVQIALPPLESKSPALSATLVFRPTAKATPGATIFSRYTVLWDDEAGAGKKQLSNGVRLSLSPDNTSRNDSGGAVALLNPLTLSVTTGNKVCLSGDFYIPDELVNLWYTDKNGNSVSLGQQQADHAGMLSLEFVLDSNFKAGESYSIVAYGNRSEISGVCVITILSS